MVKLEQNYRSTGRILKVANQLIANNPHEFSKALWSVRSEVPVCRGEGMEAAYEHARGDQVSALVVEKKF